MADTNKNIELKNDAIKVVYGLRVPLVQEFIGFEMDIMSPTCVSGRFVVSEKSAQSFGVLHGGISAFLAESLGSLGAYLASGLQRIAGVEVSTSHLRPAPVGTEIEVKATPVYIGHRLHVWEVKLTSAKRSNNDLPKQESSKTSEPALFSVSKFTAILIPSNPTAKNQDVKRIPSKL